MTCSTASGGHLSLAGDRRLIRISFLGNTAGWPRSMQDDDALSVPGGRSTSTSPRNTPPSNKGMLLLVTAPAAAIMVVCLLVVSGGRGLVGGSLGDGCELQRERRRPVGRIRLEMVAIYIRCLRQEMVAIYPAGNGRYYMRGLAGCGPGLPGIG